MCATSNWTTSSSNHRRVICRLTFMSTVMWPTSVPSWRLSYRAKRRASKCSTLSLITDRLIYFLILSAYRLLIKINYETSPKAAALLWLTPEQTLGKQHPYLFSQCQAIAARSLLPCQDTPAVKFTYRAVVKHPAELTALLSAIRISSENGTTEYEQTVPIPSYLLAIAVGAIVSRTVGPQWVFDVADRNVMYFV